MTAAAENWVSPTTPLEELVEGLGIEQKFLEWPDELSLTIQKFPRERVALRDETEWPAQRAKLDKIFDDLLRKYGTALTLEFKIGMLRPLELRDGRRSKGLDEFYAQVKDSDTLDLYLKIDKRVLLKHWSIDGGAHAEVKLFLFPDELVRTLLSPLDKLTKDPRSLLWAFNTDKKVVILVPSHQKGIELRGDFLSVVGGAAMSRWKAHVPDQQSDTSKVNYFREQAKQALRWANFDLSPITPLHLIAEPAPSPGGAAAEPEADDPVAGAVYAQLLACSLLYIAGHASRRDDVKEQGGAERQQPPLGPLWLATFAADKYLARFNVDDAGKLVEALRAGAASPWEASRMIAEVVKWTYSGERDVKDRLGVLQGVIANSLQESNPAVNCRELARQAAEVKKRVEWGWDSFVHGRLEKYFEQVKELEETVESTARSYNDQVQALTKMLIDNMLAAVGVVVGSFIAAIFKPPFGVNVFRFGTIIYTVYLAVLPATVGLISAWQRFSDSRKLFLGRQKEFAKRLTPEEVRAIVGTAITERDRWFRRWFGLTAVIYLFVLFLMSAAIVEVPRLIRNWGDEFELAEVSYGAAAGDSVQLIVRGQSFDKDKEITAEIGGAKFTNTDGGTIKVHGTTVLSMSARQKELAALGEGQRSVTVRQGLAGPKQLELPQGRAPITKPDFQRWSREPGGAGLSAVGAGFDSITAVTYEGRPLEFKLADGGGRLSLPDFKAQKAGAVLDITLHNGEQLQTPVSADLVSPPRKSRA